MTAKSTKTGNAREVLEKHAGGAEFHLVAHRARAPRIHDAPRELARGIGVFAIAQDVFQKHFERVGQLGASFYCRHREIGVRCAARLQTRGKGTRVYRHAIILSRLASISNDFETAKRAFAGAGTTR